MSTAENARSQKEIEAMLTRGEIDLVRVIDAVIRLNGIIGVGLITLADAVASQIRQSKQGEHKHDEPIEAEPEPALDGARISRNPRFNDLWEALQRCTTAILTAAYENTTPTVRISYRAHLQNAQHLLRALEHLSAAIR